jgi:hypothetical protein
VCSTHRVDHPSAGCLVIYDCFPFFNELDLLEIRLNVLAPVVDRFVLVEATHTHQGSPKPLYFAESARRFSEFKNRMQHVVVRDLPEGGGGSWDLERRQRRGIHSGLASATATDAILVSDVDEIPTPAKLRAAAAMTGTKIFRLQAHAYFLDNVLSENPFAYAGSRPVLAPYGAFADVQHLRDLALTFFVASPPGVRGIYDRLRRPYLRLRHRVRFIEKAGWHFGWLGGTDAVVQKLEATAHAELNKPGLKDRAKIQRTILEGASVFGGGSRFSVRPLAVPLPDYVLEHRERYRHLFRDPERLRSGAIAAIIANSSRR